ncbi:hypothetical protein F511_15662 [Dorcoceras hygrometricum]|uniref:Uncharacterized protein n=1 Tax=Dorcoceras hygrometricum TaxID=472368 RepID=A0A2Z7C580_9LAMI|nr:hypothetical protein F511_15662 [Dorcoceras hygrometricum]
MASSLVSNTNQVHFASVLAMDNSEIVAMFEALVASGPNGFLGCMSDVFETALIEFYQNATVRDIKVVSTVQGKLVEISEEVFARTFQLSVEGLIDINETAQMEQTETAEREQPLEIDVREETVAAGQTVEKADEIKHWFDLSYEEFTARRADRIVESASETYEEQETVAYETGVVEQQLKAFVAPEVDESPAATTAKDIDLATVTYVVQSSSDEELLSIDYLLKRIPGDMMLPSVLAAEPTKIKFVLGISILRVADGDLYKESPPKIALTDKGKAPFVEAGIVKGHRTMRCLRRLAFLTSLNEDIAAKEENVLTWAETDSVQVALQRKESRRLDDSHNEVLDKIKQLEKTILDAFYQRNQVSLGLIKGIRQDTRNDIDVHSLGLKAVRTQTAILSIDQADARKEANEQKAIIADIDESLATIRSELLDFCAQAQENYNNLSSQLGELVAYINRGNDKKGEESRSRRPQPPPDDQNRPSGGSASRGGGGGGSGGSGRRDDRRGSSIKRGSGSSGAGGPYKKNADVLKQIWFFGSVQISGTVYTDVSYSGRSIIGSIGHSDLSNL